MGKSRLKVAVLALLVVLTFGCERASVTKEDKSAEPAAKAKTETVAEIIIPVQVENPTRKDISSYFTTTSRVEAEKRVQVLAEGIGECEKLLAEEGDVVTAGQVLAELDRSEALATIGQTEVQVRQAKTSYEIAERSLAEGIGSKAERDNAKFSYDQALATLNMHKVQLDKLTIRAPITGVITKRNILLGQVVSTGASLFQIVDPNSFILQINPPERELSRLMLGQVAKVVIDAIGAKEFEARVQRINPGIDSATGTLKVVLEFAPDVRKLLREAAFARVQLVTDTHKESTLVPKDAVVEENARKYLFIVEEDTSPKPGKKAEEGAEPAAAPAEAKPEEAKSAEPADKPETKPDEAGKPRMVANRIEVETGLEDSNYVEVLSELPETAQVVVLGQHTLKPGSKVTVTKADAEVAANVSMDAQQALEKSKERSANEKPVPRRHGDGM